MALIPTRTDPLDGNDLLEAYNTLARFINERTTNGHTPIPTRISPFAGDSVLAAFNSLVSSVNRRLDVGVYPIQPRILPFGGSAVLDMYNTMVNNINLKMPAGISSGMVSLSNHTNLPGDLKSQIDTSANTLSRTQCRSSGLLGQGYHTNITGLFVNEIYGKDSEVAGDYDFDLYEAFEYPMGTFYTVTFATADHVNIPRTHGRVWCDTVVDLFGTPVQVPYASDFAWHSYKEATSASVSQAPGSYKHCHSVTTSGLRADGMIKVSGSHPEYRMGTGVARGGRLQPIDPSKVSAGSLPTFNTTVILKDNAFPGFNYTVAPSIVFWYGVAGAGNKGARNPGSGIQGFASVASGSLTTTQLTNGGTGLSAASLPLPFISGGNLITSGFGGEFTAYGPAIALSLPSTPLLLCHLFGDSITDGGPSQPDANTGFIEHCLNVRGISTFKTAVNGESCDGWLANNANWIAVINAALAKGMKKPEWMYQALLTNDFQNFVITKAQAQTKNGSVNAAWKTVYGSQLKIALPTILPSMHTNLGAPPYFTTLAEQDAPRNANYGVGGSVQGYNADLLASVAPVCDARIDVAGLVHAATDTTKFRVDNYGGDCDNTYNEPSAPGYGIHPSSNAQQFLEDNLDTSQIA